MNKNKTNSFYEDINYSRKMQGKRALANSEGTLFDLRIDSQKLFKAFNNAKTEVNNYLNLIPTKYRLGSIQAQLLQCFLAKNLDEILPVNFRRGRNNRLIVDLNGYIILFKKLNKKGYPMNIKTGTVDAISNQLSLNLFESESFAPILYFGYEVNKLGDLVNPRIVYIDEGVIKFSLSEDQFKQTIFNNKKVNKIEEKPEISPKLKNKDIDDNSEVA